MMTGCSSKLFSDLAGGVLFLGTSQMFEICPLSRALSLLARPQPHLKKKFPATLFKSFIFRRLMPPSSASAPNYDAPVGEASKWRQQRDVMSGRESEALKVVCSPLLPDTCDSKNLSISKCP